MNKYKLIKNDNTPISHTMMGPPFGSYCVPNDKLKEFTNLYLKAVNENKSELHVVERALDIGPLVIDVDIDLEKQYKKRLYTLKDIKYLIRKTNGIIDSYYNIENRSHMRVLITEKAKPTITSKSVKGESGKKVRVKDGFHIYYPYIPLDVEMRELISKELAATIKKEKPFSHIPYTNDETKLIDSSVIISNGMVMYGSVKPKKMGGQRYELTYVINSDLKKCKLDNYSMNKIVNITSNRRFWNKESFPLRDTISEKDLILAKKRAGIKVKESIVLSIDTDSDECTSGDSDDDYDMLDNIDKSKKDMDDPLVGKVKKIPDGGGLNSSMFLIDEKYKKTIDIAKKLTSILSKKRSTAFEDWIHVCWALNNISRNNELYEDFIKFSKKAKNYDRASCKKKWEEATTWKTKNKQEGFGISSLKMWACKDNPKACTKILRESVSHLFDEVDGKNDFDMAQLVYALYKHTYVCSDLINNIWYEFQPQKHKWVYVPKANTLKTKLSTELAEEFGRLAENHMHEYIAAISGKASELARKQNKMNETTTIINNLKKNPVKERLIHECANLFYDSEFDEKLDANKYLIGFNNGVYDLRTHSFRDGTPDDYLTFSVGYDYIEYDMNHKYVIYVIKCLQKVQTDEEMRNHVLVLFSSFLTGNIKDERFDIFTGSGANGKSLTVKLLQKTLGDYAGVLKPTVFTRKRGASSQADPEIAALKGKRFVVLNEPEANEVIHVGLLKEMTGGDKIQARELYKNNIEFYPQCKFVMLCNVLPNINANDGGTWRRLKVTPWESKFVDVDENGLVNGKRKLEDKEFPKDDTLEGKFDKWRSAFMWLLLKKYYRIYEKNGIPDPDKVTAETKRYKEQNDSFYAFITDEYDITGSNKNKEYISSVYDGFKEWYKVNYPGCKTPPSKEFKEYISKMRRITVKGKLVYGLKYSVSHDYQEEDDEEEE